MDFVAVVKSPISQGNNSIMNPEPYIESTLNPEPKVQLHGIIAFNRRLEIGDSVGITEYWLNITEPMMLMQR